ncbi:large conductance mechanosensitive channel protein MscL [Microbacterium sp. GXF7504]
MLKGFKDFIMRGNVIDLAVAVVIGSAFTAIVTAVVDSIITPLIAIFWKADAAGIPGIQVPDLYGGSVTFPIGTLISAVVSFLAVAVVVYFVFVMPMNTWKARQAAKAGVQEPEEEKLPTEQELLIQIRDLLEKQQQTPRI